MSEIYDGDDTHYEGERIPKEIIDTYFNNDDVPSDLQELAKQSSASITYMATDFVWQNGGYEDDDNEDDDLDVIDLKPIYVTYKKNSTQYPKEFDTELKTIIQQLDDLPVKDYDEDDTDQEQISMNVLTFNHLQSVFSTYGWLLSEDIVNESKNLYFHKNKYIALVTNRVTINNMVINIESEEFKVIFYSSKDGKCLAHCEYEYEIENVLSIIGK